MGRTRAGSLKGHRQLRHSAQARRWVFPIAAGNSGPRTSYAGDGSSCHSWAGCYDGEMPAGALFVSPMLVSIEQCSYGSLKVGNASVACEGGRSLRPGALDASGRHEERELSTTADDDASPATLYELAPARLCIRRCDAGMCKRVDNSGGGTTYNLKPARRI